MPVHTAGSMLPELMPVHAAGSMLPGLRSISAQYSWGSPQSLLNLRLIFVEAYISVIRNIECNEIRNIVVPVDVGYAE